MTSQEQKDWVKKQMHGMDVVKNGEKRPKEEIVHKYSNKGQGQLSEACIIEGKPYFIAYTVNEQKRKDFIVSPPLIQEDIRVLKPPHKEQYPYEPYEFKSINEPNYYLQKAKQETVDSLYQKIKSIVTKYNDIDEKTINLLSADILGSYFQDRFSTLHYLIVVGDNGTGKSAFGDTFECLGYRPVNVTNTTEAFWFRIFGTNEPGQVTIIAEEIDKLDDNSQIMSVLKVGYQPNAKVPRMNNENDKMDFYYPFCFKIMIAERSPNEDKAKGLLDRSFKIKTYKGCPELKIKEIRNPQGNKKRQKQSEEINEVRNTLLMFKLVHFKDPYREVDIGLDGRDEELCKPLLQLFFTLGASEETLRELEDTLQHFLNIKNTRKHNSKEALIYPILVNAIPKYGFTIDASQIWEEIIESLEGEKDNDKPNIFYSADYGPIYRNRITKLICDKFGGEMRHKRNGNVITFDPDYLAKVGKIYDDTKGIKTKLIDGDSCDACDPLIGNAPGLVRSSIDKNYEKLSTDLEANNDNIANKKGPYLPGDESHGSHGSLEEYPSTCYYCDEYFDGKGKEVYEKHVIIKHPKMPCYPGLPDIELYSLTPKGMKWEI